MSSWAPGHATISTLIRRGHLERIRGDATNAGYLITQARQRLNSATALLQSDVVAAFELAYDGVRQAATALLVQQGLRPKSEGGHVAITEAVRAQFGETFDLFNAMRRIRNKLEYPLSPDDVAISPATAEEATAYARRTIQSAEQMLPNLGIWQP